MHKTGEKQTAVALNSDLSLGFRWPLSAWLQQSLLKSYKATISPRFGSLGEGPTEHSGLIKLRAIPPCLPAFCLSWSATLPKPKCSYTGVVVNSCPTLCDLVDYSPPGSCVHGTPSPMDPGIKPTSPALVGRFFTAKPPGNPLLRSTWASKNKTTMKNLWCQRDQTGLTKLILCVFF